MRQAKRAFKMDAIKAARGVTLAAMALLGQSCATLLGGEKVDTAAITAEELRVARAENAVLKSQLTGMKTAKTQLETKVAELERKVARAAANAAAPSSPVAPATIAPTTTAAPELKTEKSPSTAPAAPVVAAPNADVALPGAPVPVDQSPRLVQPTFSSAEEIFENEAASPEIKMTSVLWGVHLASYRHREEASAGWKKLQRDNPDELGLLEPRIEKVAIAGKGEYLRLVGGGFSSREKAKALCDTLATKGVFCRVTNFGGDRLSMLEAGALR